MMLPGRLVCRYTENPTAMSCTIYIVTSARMGYCYTGQAIGGEIALACGEVGATMDLQHLPAWGNLQANFGWYSVRKR